MNLSLERVILGSLMLGVERRKGLKRGRGNGISNVNIMFEMLIIILV